MPDDPARHSLIPDAVLLNIVIIVRDCVPYSTEKVQPSSLLWRSEATYYIKRVILGRPDTPKLSGQIATAREEYSRLRTTLQSERQDHPEDFHTLVVSLLRFVETFYPLEKAIAPPSFPAYGLGTFSSPPAPKTHAGFSWKFEHSQLLFGYPITS